MYVSYRSVKMSMAMSQHSENHALSNDETLQRRFFLKFQSIAFFTGRFTKIFQPEDKYSRKVN